MASQLCQSCHVNPATIHFTEIEDQDKTDLHLCEACATAQGLNNEAFVSNLVDQATRGIVGTANRCPHCGITFEEFRSKGRFGCPKDYEVFQQELAPLLEKMHGGARRHRGRLPRGQHEVESTVSDRLLHLRRELQKAVSEEKYEDAARIRDEIHGIEQSRSGRPS